jgi:hypothetical protein
MGAILAAKTLHAASAWSYETQALLTAAVVGGFLNRLPFTVLLTFGGFSATL